MFLLQCLVHEMIAKHHAGNVALGVYCLLDADSIATSITAHIEQSLDGGLDQGLLATALADHLSQTDAFPTLVWQHLVTGKCGDIAYGIVLLSLTVSKLRHVSEQPGKTAPLPVPRRSLTHYSTIFPPKAP